MEEMNGIKTRNRCGSLFLGSLAEREEIWWDGKEKVMEEEGRAVVGCSALYVHMIFWTFLGFEG